MAVTTLGWVLLAAMAMAAVTTAALGVYAWRHREEPGATGFFMMMVAETIWAGGYVVALLIFDPTWRVVALNVKWLGISVYIGLLFFALEYTGHDELATPRNMAIVAIPYLVSVLLVWTVWWHGLWWSVEIVPAQGLAVLQFDYYPIFWVHTAYAYALILLSAGLFLRLIFVSDYLYADQSFLLVFGVLASTSANVIDVVGLEPGGVIDVTPIVFAIASVAYGYALFRHRLFDLVPATRRLGRNAAIGQLDTGVVIVDTNYRVVYCNEAAEPVLGCTAADALEQELRDLVDLEDVDLDAPDALAELERGDTVYEVRTSPITDRHDRTIGHTLVAHDVTARKERERALAAQRDELETVSALNGLIRGVLQALVSETDRDGIERAVCDRIVEGDLYHTACVGDVATWSGDAERWTVAGMASGTDLPTVPDERLERTGEDSDVEPNLPTVPEETDGSWIVVPIVYGRTVYGAIGLATDRDSVSEQERSVLGELGEAVGHAINAVETRRLLSAEAVVELDVESAGDDDPLVRASTDTDASLTLRGIVPSSDRKTVAYVDVDGDFQAAESALDAASDGRVRRIRSTADGGLLEWRLTGDDPLGAMVDLGGQVRGVDAVDGRVEYHVEVAAEQEGRSLVDALSARFDRITLLAKRQRSGPVDDAATLPAESVEDLTDRQQEALEAAYRAGYFEWPRDSTAEDVAETLDITPSTLHSHLRKAEGTLFTELFERTAAGN